MNRHVAPEPLRENYFSQRHRGRREILTSKKLLDYGIPLPLLPLLSTFEDICLLCLILGIIDKARVVQFFKVG